ncbi:CRISPR-associated protein Cas4 [Halarchaeum salinum]|uniref:CRISPR-associated protein Cas4 n=1 Tax=Halarchaeum salinum TaxID=489912 RepID=UPI001B87CC61
MPTPVSFADLATAAYCPRQLYYRRMEDAYDLPASVERVRDLASRYPTLVEASDAALRNTVAVEPATYRARLGAVLTRYPGLASPDETDVLLTGKDCRGRVAKIVSPLAPTLVSPGEPPETGVWEPQKVRAVAAAKALAWRERAPVEYAYVEYPRHGIVREVSITTRAKAAYRRVLRAVRGMDGPPSRLGDDAKCGGCDYRERCGVRTRSLSSLL